MAEKPKSVWRSNLGVLSITSGLWMIGGNMTGPFWGLYVLYLGGSPFHIGLISAVSAILSLPTSLIGGHLADIISRKKLVYGLQIGIALNGIIYILAPSWEWLLLARSIESVISGLRNPAFSAFLADSTKAERRTMDYALWNSVPPLFGLASPYIIGVLMDRYGILPAQRLAYVVLMVVATVTALIRYRYLEDTTSVGRGLRLGFDEVVRGTLSDLGETIRALSRRVRVLIVLGCLYQLAVSMAGIFAVTYAVEDVIHVASSDWGLVSTASTIIIIVSSVPLALLANRQGKRKLVLVSLLVTPFAVLGFAYSTGLNQVLLFYSTITLLGNLGGIASQALFTDYFPMEHRGRINAFMSVIGSTQNFSFSMMGGGIVGSLGNVVGGVLYGQVSYSAPFIAAALVIAVTALLSFVYLKETMSPEK
ncbi:MAG: MFS transporter [Candidatus Bathyarchaeota archaeon]|nr:MFS transporter [Candidatus Bathyarchaeota archaeon]